jgi:hypothetical protein
LGHVCIEKSSLLEAIPYNTIGDAFIPLVLAKKKEEKRRKKKKKTTRQR